MRTVSPCDAGTIRAWLETSRVTKTILFYSVPGHVSCESHAGEGADGLVGQVQRELRGRVQHVRDDLQHQRDNKGFSVKISCWSDCNFQLVVSISNQNRDLVRLGWTESYEASTIKGL